MARRRYLSNKAAKEYGELKNFQRKQKRRKLLRTAPVCGFCGEQHYPDRRHG